jgi:hypothetical protein
MDICLPNKAATASLSWLFALHRRANKISINARRPIIMQIALRATLDESLEWSMQMKSRERQPSLSIYLCVIWVCARESMGTLPSFLPAIMQMRRAGWIRVCARTAKAVRASAGKRTLSVQITLVSLHVDAAMRAGAFLRAPLELHLPRVRRRCK